MQVHPTALDWNEHLFKLLLIFGQGSRLSSAQLTDKSDLKGERPSGRQAESNGHRPSFLDLSSNLHKKRKASQMEDDGGEGIKDEPGLSDDDSPSPTSSTSSRAFPIKQTISMIKVPQAPSSADNGKKGPTIFGPAPPTSLHHDAPSRVFKKEVVVDDDRPGDDDQEEEEEEEESSDDVEVIGRGSSSLTEPSMWDVSESELHASDKEEESSDGESVGLGPLSSGVDRQERVKLEEVSQGEDDTGQGNSDGLSNQNHISTTEPTQSATNADDRTEQPPATSGNDRTDQPPPQENSTSHNHDDRPRNNESNATPVATTTVPPRKKKDEKTVAGRIRQRAAPQNLLAPREIPRSWKTATPADKMLVKMKLKGCSWVEIRKAWEEITGEEPAKSTLPNRYTRVKDNLMRLKSGDVCDFSGLFFFFFLFFLSFSFVFFSFLFLCAFTLLSVF